MNVVIGTVLLWGLAAFVGAKLRAAGDLVPALRATGKLLVYTGSRVLVALMGAAFVAELVPRALIDVAFGQGSGLAGVLLATALGPLTPGGGFVSFAVGAAALNAGAAPAPVVAYVTSWSLFAVTKFLGYELPFLGPRPALLRLAVSWPIPLAVGALALAAL